MTGIITTKRWVEPLDGVADVEGMDGSTARLGYRRARAGDLVESYPAGTHDIELMVSGQPTPEALSVVTQRILADHPRCRRVVLPVAEDDLTSIAWAESAGFRYVVNVETPEGAFSLLVVEPDWVIEQPQILDELPLDR